VKGWSVSPERCPVREGLPAGAICERLTCPRYSGAIHGVRSAIPAKETEGGSGWTRPRCAVNSVPELLRRHHQLRSAIQ